MTMRPSDEDEYEDDLEESDSPDAERLRRFLARVLKEMGLVAQIRVTEGSEELRAEISGEELGILIGRRGQTIDAVEYLAGIAVYPGSHSRKHVEIDAEGYKERRRRQIERVAAAQGRRGRQAWQTRSVDADDAGRAEDSPPHPAQPHRRGHREPGPGAEPLGRHLSGSLESAREPRGAGARVGGEAATRGHEPPDRATVRLAVADCAHLGEPSR